MQSWGSPVAAGGLTPQGRPSTSHTHSLALQDICFFLFCLLHALKAQPELFYTLHVILLTFKIEFNNSASSELVHTKKSKLSLFLYASISVSTTL